MLIFRREVPAEVNMPWRMSDEVEAGELTLDTAVDWYANHAFRLLCATAPIIADEPVTPGLDPARRRRGARFEGSRAAA